MQVLSKFTFVCQQEISKLLRMWKSKCRQWLSGIGAFMATIIMAISAQSATALGISVESLIVVDCLLPGQVRQLGPTNRYITPRRPIKTSARICAIRGGEYVSYDRADYRSALKVWMTDAETGDAKAQTYVAEIYERGLGTDPNYVEAAKWYKLAAKQGYRPAQLSLGRLYEQGQGVEKDLLSALNLYRSANGLKQDELGFVSAMQNAAKSGTSEELESLRKQIKKLEKNNEELRRQFEESTIKAEESSALLQQLQIDIKSKQRLLEEASRRDDYGNIVSDLQSQISQLQQNLNEKDEQIRSTSEKLERQIIVAKQAVEEARSSQDSQKIIAIMKDRLADQQAQIDTARKSAENRSIESEETIARLAKELSTAQAVNDAADVISRLKIELVEQKQLRTQESKQHQISIAKLQIELSDQQNKFLNAQNADDSKVVIGLLEQQIGQYQNKLDAQSEQNKALQAVLNKEIETRKNYANTLKNQEGAKKVIAGLKSQIKKQSKLLKIQSQRNNDLVEKATAQAKALAESENNKQLAASKGPTIVLKVPPLIASRGPNEVEVQAGQQVYLAGGVVAPSGVKSFTLNGVPAELDVNNLFMLRVDIKNEKLPLELKITDSQNRESSKNLVLKPIASVNVAESHAKPSRKMKWGKYHALVIGNNNYTDPQWSNLSNAVNDAKTVAAVLETKYGFETNLILNATRVQMLEAIESMRNKLTENDNLLIYYAGHGQRDDANNRAYWIPVDSSAESSTNWIPSYQITDHVNAMNARHVLLVVDSCYAGLMTRSSGVNAMLVGMTAEQKQQKMRDRLGRRTRMLITAGDNTEVLDAGKQGDHSIFAEAFIAALENNTGVIDSEGVYKIVQPYVSKNTYRINKQSVVYAPIPRARHEGGEFYFSSL